jgi:hypothetical protein
MTAVESSLLPFFPVWLVFLYLFNRTSTCNFQYFFHDRISVVAWSSNHIQKVGILWKKKLQVGRLRQERKQMTLWNDNLKNKNVHPAAAADDDDNDYCTAQYVHISARITCRPFWTKGNGHRMGPLPSETRCCSLVMLETTQLHCDTSPSSVPVAVCKYRHDISTIKINHVEKCTYTSTA